MVTTAEQVREPKLGEALLALGVIATEGGRLTRRLAFWATVAAAPIPVVSVAAALPVTAPVWAIGKSVELVGKVATKIGSLAVAETPLGSSVRRAKIGLVKSYSKEVFGQSVSTLMHVMAPSRR